MEQLKFNNKTYLKIDIKNIPGGLEKTCKNVLLIKGQCLKNSYEIAKATSSMLVEGFLITKFIDKNELDCVGHAWNIYNDIHFDLSVDLVNTSNVESNFYFVKEIYEHSKANITPMDFFDVSKKLLQFKSDVLLLELKVRHFINLNTADEKK